MASSTYNLNRYTAALTWFQELLRLSRAQAYKMVWHAASGGRLDAESPTISTAALRA